VKDAAPASAGTGGRFWLGPLPIDPVALDGALDRIAWRSGLPRSSASGARES
jgi:hypothetical protein